MQMAQISCKGHGVHCKGHLSLAKWELLLLLHCWRWVKRSIVNLSMSSARRRSFRRGGGETHRFFIDNERRRCMYGGFQSVYGSFKNLRCSYYRMAFSQPRKGHAWIPTAVVVRAQQKCSTVHNRFSRYLLWYGSKYMIGRIRFLCMEVMVLK